MHLLLTVVLWLFTIGQMLEKGIVQKRHEKQGRLF